MIWLRHTQNLVKIYLIFAKLEPFQKWLFGSMLVLISSWSDNNPTSSRERASCCQLKIEQLMRFLIDYWVFSLATTVARARFVIHFCLVLSDWRASYPCIKLKPHDWHVFMSRLHSCSWHWRNTKWTIL